MIFIEIIQNSGGRTGHKMKDYLTAFCFYFICNYKIIINDYWKFPNGALHQNHIHMFNLNDTSSGIFIEKPKNNVITITYSLKTWLGMKFKTFEKILTEINSKQIHNMSKSIIVKLCEATRIQLSDVYNWELSSLIKKGTYKRLTSYLRKRFLDSPTSIQIPLLKNEANAINISIHIRKGDVHHREIHRSVEYYKTIISNLKILKLKKNIFIYTEKWKDYNGEDVYNLMNLKDDNTKIEVIFEVCLYEYFLNMINSDIFVPTIGQGSLSDLAINYKSKNTIIIINHDLRQNKFNDNMNNQLVKTNNMGNFNVKYLYQCIHLNKIESKKLKLVK